MIRFISDIMKAKCMVFHHQQRNMFSMIFKLEIIANAIKWITELGNSLCHKLSICELGSMDSKDSKQYHYCDDIISPMASQITSLTVAYSTVCSCIHQRKHRSSESLAFVRGIYRSPVNSPHKWPATRKMFPFDDVIMLHVLCVWWKDWGISLNSSSFRRDSFV